MIGNKKIHEYNRNDSPLHNKSYDFAIRVVNMVNYIKCTEREYVLTNQVLRSGTSVGAMVHEAEFAQSPADFINKLSIALKECNETYYWINLLKDTERLGEREAESMLDDCNELLALLISSIKTVKKRNY